MTRFGHLTILRQENELQIVILATRIPESPAAEVNLAPPRRPPQHEARGQSFHQATFARPMGGEDGWWR
jgi:hypothetical protein